MKNALNYYYNLVTDDLHRRGNKYYFSINSINYVLDPYYGDINYLNALYNFLVSNNILCLNIIPNKDKQILTIINDIPYILLGSNLVNRRININDILKYSIIIESKTKNEWNSMKKNILF